jgi:hypothetical protein
LTRVPAESRSCFVPSPSMVKGAPPPQSWYISGVHIVPSKSNATSLGSLPQDWFIPALVRTETASTQKAERISTSFLRISAFASRLSVSE